MAYQALYRKYRPQTFDDVVGQEPVTRTLKNAVMTGRIGHAYLFCGTRGTGKTTTARILSRALNCLHPVDGNPCNECESCRGIINETILDVIEIDAASNNGVDNIRSIREDAVYSAANVAYKVYIIDEAHMLSPSAYNALLKVLEEPPKGVVFILATTERVSATILSRCQRFDFKRITPKDIVKRLRYIADQEGVEVEDRALALMAEAGDGALRDSVGFLDQCMGQGTKITYENALYLLGRAGDRYIEDIFKALSEEDDQKAVLSFLSFVQDGKPVAGFIDSFVRFAHELLYCKLLKDPASMLTLSDEDMANRKQLADSFSKEKLLYCIRLATEAGVAARQIANASMLIEVALVKMCCPQFDSLPDSQLARLAEMERKLAKGVSVVQTVVQAPKEKKKVERYMPPEQCGETVAKIKKQWQAIMKKLSSQKERAMVSALSAADVLEDDGRLVVMFDSPEALQMGEDILRVENRTDTLFSVIEEAVGACLPIVYRCKKDYTREVDEEEDAFLALEKQVREQAGGEERQDDASDTVSEEEPEWEEVPMPTDDDIPEKDEYHFEEEDNEPEEF